MLETQSQCPVEAGEKENLVAKICKSRRLTAVTIKSASPSPKNGLFVTNIQYVKIMSIKTSLLVKGDERLTWNRFGH